MRPNKRVWQKMTEAVRSVKLMYIEGKRGKKEQIEVLGLVAVLRRAMGVIASSLGP